VSKRKGEERKGRVFAREREEKIMREGTEVGLETGLSTLLFIKAAVSFKSSHSSARMVRGSNK
jgi:hypothetical protein